jgi:hypothetical protein
LNTAGSIDELWQVHSLVDGCALLLRINLRFFHRVLNHIILFLPWYDNFAIKKNYFISIIRAFSLHQLTENLFVLHAVLVSSEFKRYQQFDIKSCKTV